MGQHRKRETEVYVSRKSNRKKFDAVIWTHTAGEPEFSSVMRYKNSKVKF